MNEFGTLKLSSRWGGRITFLKFCPRVQGKRSTFVITKREKGGGKGPSHKATCPRAGTVRLRLFLLESRGGRKAAVSFHTALSSGKRADSVEAKALSGVSISPRMLQPLLTGHGSQDCGSFWPLTSDQRNHTPSPWKAQGSLFLGFGVQNQPVQISESIPKIKAGAIY